MGATWAVESRCEMRQIIFFVWESPKKKTRQKICRALFEKHFRFIF
jgi:hypothetical protein